jgi:hypothetical protein
LQQLSQLKAKHKRAQEDLLQIREMMESAGAIRYDKVNIQSSPDNDQLANYVIKLERAEKRALKLADQYLEQYMVIREQINQISPQMYSDVLYLRYVLGMKLWDIADELNYDYDWLRHLHGRALAEFGKVFADQLKQHT